MFVPFQYVNSESFYFLKKMTKRCSSSSRNDSFHQVSICRMEESVTYCSVLSDNYRSQTATFYLIYFLLQRAGR